MDSLKTLLLILTPLFIGFAIRVPKIYAPLLDKFLGWLVYIILLLMGLGLSQVENLLAQMDNIVLYVLTLFALLMTLNIGFLWAFECLNPWQMPLNQEEKTVKLSLLGSLKQPAVVVLGVLLGFLLPEHFLPPESLSTYALMLLVLLVGMQLRSNGIPLREVLLNRRGMQVSLVFMLSCALAGLLFAAIFADVSWDKGLALSSGYGWYSLSGIVMTQTYGATWGSVALLNDLLREFFALAFIPMLMRRSSAAAVGIGGATSLDFTLPIIRNSGGLAVVPLAISFGFVVNVLSPILMLIFGSLKG